MSDTTLYLNVVARINADYADLIRHLQEMDLRMAYLQIFEVSLSQALSRPLWEIDVYREQQARTPMPSDPYTVMDFQTFRAWITVYEIVMRREGLIGKKQIYILGLDDEEEEEAGE